jgi:Uma2 family endonuclease
VVDLSPHASSDAERVALIAERASLGHDKRDEMWEGHYVMSPVGSRRHSSLQVRTTQALLRLLEGSGLEALFEINIGVRRDFRIPDATVLAASSIPPEEEIFIPTAVLVVEVLSPRDDAYRKLGFYYRHDVQEVLLVDPAAAEVRILVRGEHEFELAGRSAVLGVSAEQLTAMIIRSEAPR